MKLYSYVVAYDGGSAPNPFWGFCTLAICKPKIRKHASVGDWVVGIGSAASDVRGRLIYAMRVAEVIPIPDYFTDARFADKKPDLCSTDWRRHHGDNQYMPGGNGTWNMLPGPHNIGNMAKDVSGENVLVGKHFYYFGRNALKLPASLAAIGEGGRGHRCNFGKDLIDSFVQWLESSFSPGIQGHPADAENADLKPPCSGCAQKERSVPPKTVGRC
jgi:hypothetical protein